MSAAGTTHGRFAAAPAERIVIERGGRRLALRLPRNGVAAAGGALLLLIGWSLAAAGYMLFHDTVVAELRQGASATARGYESQITALRGELERTRTRGMVEASGLDSRLAELGLRQEAIEKRQSRLAELAETVPAEPAARAASADEAIATYSLKPAPLDGAGPALDGGGAAAVLPSFRAASPQQSSQGLAERVSVGLDAVERGQARALEGVGARTSERRRTLERVYDAARIRRPAIGDGRARGGPYEPLPARAFTFEARADEIAAERAMVTAFEHGLTRVPLRTPAPGAPLSSGFGARPDPFLGRLAFHAGLDFERSAGEPVRATAAGRITNAGWSGGYGNMVEIDHGGGLTTRFGHLSQISVKVGDEVRIGAPIGLVGSTGRSTGPHLHYETRVDGEAVDPMRFLNAGRILAAAGQ